MSILKRYVISREIDGKSGKSLLQLVVAKNKDIHLPLEKVEVGAKTERLLKNLSPFNQKKEKEKMLHFILRKQSNCNEDFAGQPSTSQCRSLASRCTDPWKQHLQY